MRSSRMVLGGLFRGPVRGTWRRRPLQACPYSGEWKLTSDGTGAQIGTGQCSYGDKQINNLPAGNYTLDFHGTREAMGTYSFEVR
jgi:hypothetical protein